MQRTKEDIYVLIQKGETFHLECKKAQGGLPSGPWEIVMGDCVTRADQSSRYGGGEGNNPDERLKRMLSLEKVIVDHFDSKKVTAGFHTQHEEAPWILLDLGSKRTITGISIDAFGGVIFNNCRPTRHLCIWVTDDGKHEKLVDKEELLRKRYRSHRPSEEESQGTLYPYWPRAEDREELVLPRQGRHLWQGEVNVRWWQGRWWR